MYVSCNSEKSGSKQNGTREKFNKLRVPLDREASPSGNYKRQSPIGVRELAQPSPLPAATQEGEEAETTEKSGGGLGDGVDFGQSGCNRQIVETL